ncbi:MAG: hypothetical protein GX851_07870 [Clostridiales bacterium]|nr:hypothetical protein [Clostridiales bacterium]
MIRMFKNVNSASIEALMELNDTDAVKNRAIEYLTGETDEEKTPYELVSFMRNELPKWMTSKPSIGNGEKRKLLVVRGRTEVEVSRFSKQFDENTIKMLAAAIAKDITGMSAEEVFAPSSLPLGAIMFEGDCASDGRKMPEREVLECDIYESMENTVSLLRELGIYETLAQKSETVSVRLYPLSDVLMFFDYPRASEAVQGSGGVVNMLLFFNSNNDSAARTPSRTITDKAEIEALESAMRCSWYIAGASGQIAECTFANGHIGTYYIPDEK